MFESKACPVCHESFQRLAKHITKAHSEFAAEQDKLVLKRYQDGLSARKIAALPDIMYDGGTSVVRVLNRYLTPEQLEDGRKERIGKTMEAEYASGSRDWINDINAARVKTEEARKKNSEGLKKAYEDGKRGPVWAEMATEEEKARHYQKVAETLGAKAASGQLTSLFKAGSENPRWKPDRSMIAREYRKGKDFQVGDRKKIKARANYRCEQCGISESELKVIRIQTQAARMHLECDHRLPIHKGGARNWEENGQALCTTCHLKKSAAELSELFPPYE